MTKSKFFAIFLEKMFANSSFLCDFAVENKKQKEKRQTYILNN